MEQQSEQTDNPSPATGRSARDDSRNEFFADKAARFFQETNWVPILGLVAYLAAIPFLYRYAANQPLNPDPFLYGQVAKEMLQGKRLYSETWQDKPPLAFIPYLIPQALGFRAYPNFGFVLGIWLVIEGAIFFVYFRKNLPAALGCLFFLTLFPLTCWDFNWPSTEHFANPMLALMLLMALTMFRRKSFALWQAAALGALGVITFHIRQNAALAAILPLLAIFYCNESRSRKIAGLAIFAAVAAACWGAILLWIWRIGDLHGYFYTVFEYPRLYAQNGSVDDLFDLVDNVLQSHLPLVLFLSAGIALLGEYRRPVIASLIVVTVMTILPMRSSGHYWVSWFPFVAIYIALALESPAISWMGARWAGTWAIILISAIGGIDHLRAVAQTPTYAALLRLDELTERLAPPNATLLICGPMQAEPLVYISRLPAANTYSFVFQLLAPQGNILPKPANQIIDDYLQNPPGIMLVTGDYYAEAGDDKVQTLSNPARLVRLLENRYSYHRITPVPGINFLIRDPSPTKP
jgi:hypothetical protein